MMTSAVKKTITQPVTVKSEDDLLANTHPDMLYGLAITHGQPSVAQAKGSSAHDRFLQAKQLSRRH
jgi:hypothetical protein